MLLFNHMTLDRLHWACNWLYKIHVCRYKCDISNLAVKEEPSQDPRQKHQLWREAGAEEPVGLIDYVFVWTHVLYCYVIKSLRNPWCPGVIGNILTCFPVTVMRQSWEILLLYLSCRLCRHVCCGLFSPNLSELRCSWRKMTMALPFRQKANVKKLKGSIFG